jgi:hypothetical protein
MKGSKAMWTPTKTSFVLVALLSVGWAAATWLEGRCAEPPLLRDQPAQSANPLVAEAEKIRRESWKKPQIPQLGHIESIIAEAYCHPLPVSDIAPFAVPKKYYRELLKHLGDAELDKIASSESQELGTMRIAMVGGRSIRICWFWAGHKDRLCFSWCGMRYRAVGKRFAADETLELDAMVRRIHKKEVLHEKD